MPPKRSPGRTPRREEYDPVAPEDNDDDVNDEVVTLIASPRGAHVMTSDEAESPTSPASVQAEIMPLLKLAIPMQLSQLVDGMTQQVSIMMIGHLGPEQLGAAVLATMFVRILPTGRTETVFHLPPPAC